jgi:hypothetical protein
MKINKACAAEFIQKRDVMRGIAWSGLQDAEAIGPARLLRLGGKRLDNCRPNDAFDEVASSHCLTQRLRITADYCPHRIRLQQGFATDEMGFNDQFALQKLKPGRSHMGR